MSFLKRNRVKFAVDLQVCVITHKFTLVPEIPFPSFVVVSVVAAMSLTVQMLELDYRDTLGDAIMLAFSYISHVRQCVCFSVSELALSLAEPLRSRFMAAFLPIPALTRKRS